MSTESLDRSFELSSLSLKDIDSERTDLLPFEKEAGYRLREGRESTKCGDRGENPQNKLTLEKLFFCS